MQIIILIQNIVCKIIIWNCANGTLSRIIVNLDVFFFCISIKAYNHCVQAHQCNHKKIQLFKYFNIHSVFGRGKIMQIYRLNEHWWQMLAVLRGYEKTLSHLHWIFNTICNQVEVKKLIYLHLMMIDLKINNIKWMRLLTTSSLFIISNCHLSFLFLVQVEIVGPHNRNHNNNS